MTPGAADQRAAAGRDRGAVVITGCSSGIGRACALRLDALGFRAFAGVRKDADAEELRSTGSERLEPLMLDVTDAQSISAAAGAVSERLDGEGLAGLVNNAGVGVGGPLELLPVEDLRRQLEINLVGQIAVTQALLPELRRARGRIVFMSSIGGRVATPFMGPYNASKFGIEAIADSLRGELRPWGIRVAVVEPGSIATPIWEKGEREGDRIAAGIDARGRELYGDQIEAFRAALRATAERGISPDEVAKVVVHALTSERPKTRYLVGTDAKVAARLRKLVPDRLFDRLVARQLRT
jgi:NAD(P)-dependent dehydrogenase (short-subunit alcohol dehydrogenase family)